MKMIKALAHILTDEGKNASGVTVNLETYNPSSHRWNRIGREVTDNNGKVQITVIRVQNSGAYLPMLRLTEPGNPAPRVLAQGGYVSFNSNNQILTLDFGQLEQLAETAYPLKASSGIFRRSKLTIAAHAKKASLSIAGLFRISPGLVAAGGNVNVSSNASSHAGVTPGLSSTATVKPDRVLENFNAEVLKFQAKEAELQSIISAKELQLTTRDQEIKLAKDKVNELEQKLSISKAAEKALEEKNKIFTTEASKRVPIGNIAASIGSQVDSANQKLRNENSPYRFGRIKVDLRGTMSPDGESMALASLVDIKDRWLAASLPGLNFEILPDRTPSEVTTGVEVPDVTGLTETAARRLVQAVGLRLESINKSVDASDKIPTGQSVQQSPEAGATLSRGETVFVVFAITNS